MLRSRVPHYADSVATGARRSPGCPHSVAIGLPAAQSCLPGQEHVEPFPCPARSTRFLEAPYGAVPREETSNVESPEPPYRGSALPHQETGPGFLRQDGLVNGQTAKAPLGQCGQAAGSHTHHLAACRSPVHPLAASSQSQRKLCFQQSYARTPGHLDTALKGRTAPDKRKRKMILQVLQSQAAGRTAGHNHHVRMPGFDYSADQCLQSIHQRSLVLIAVRKRGCVCQINDLSLRQCLAQFLQDRKAADPGIHQQQAQRRHGLTHEAWRAGFSACWPIQMSRNPRNQSPNGSRCRSVAANCASRDWAPGISSMCAPASSH